ncbi:hypothetical protein CMV_010791 [Castanea mollissima]|uniref:Uncharacterized protein n=1 Tax=Castanea mollissima TaxID=60419 RepID=A0A8J4VLH9_9ROSI|nr:hypothetical protein CMV_010791 [Castanea mollissima]
MQALKSLFSPSSFHLHKFPTKKPTKSFLSLFSNLSSPTKTKTKPKTPFSNSTIINYLTNTLKFSKTQALSISTRFYYVKSTEKPQSVVLFLQNLGFSETQIRSAVRVSPHILFSDIDKTLKPKIEFFQQLGFVGSDLGKFISKNSTLLSVSLERRLIPCVEILKKILCNNENNQCLLRVLRRCNGVVKGDPESRLLGNIAYLKRCGIVGSQLSMLLTRQPWLFVIQENKLRGLVSRVLEMGFVVNSRMLVYAVYTVSCMSHETFIRKLDFIRSSGFSSDECMEMFRKAPGLLRTSEEKLKLGIEFFMNTIKLERVLQIMKSKRLLKKEPSFLHMLNLTEELRYVFSLHFLEVVFLAAQRAFHEDYTDIEKCGINCKRKSLRNGFVLAAV